MKKMFTLALAAATATAFANAGERPDYKTPDVSMINADEVVIAKNQVAASSLVKANPQLKKNVRKADFSQKAVLNNATSSLKDIKKAFAESVENAKAADAGVPVYLRAGTELFCKVDLNVKGATNPQQNGTYGLNMLSSVASLGDNTYRNLSYILSNAGLNFTESINSWNYANWDNEELISENNVTADDLTIYANPPILKDISLPYPILSSEGGDSFQVGYDNNGKFSALSRIFGGSLNLSEEDLKSVANQFASQFPGATLTASIGGYSLNNPMDDSFDNDYVGTAFSAGTKSAGFEDAPEVTFSQNANAYWSNVANGDAVAAGWIQEFAKPGSPMALNKITIPFVVQCGANAKLTFEFYEIIGDEMADEPFKVYEHTFTACDEEDYQEVEIPFTTAGDIDDLPFQLINNGMLLMITGFNDETFALCSPFVNMYQYNRAAPLNSEPSNAYALLATRGANGDIQPKIATPDYLMGGCTLNSISMTLDASYPYLQLGANNTQENPDNEGDVISEAKSANVILKKATDGVWAELYFSGDDIQEIGYYNYDNPEDESFANWLEMGIDDTPQEVPIGQNTYIVNPLNIYFGVKEGQEPGNVTIALTYNGLVYPIHIGAETVGIDNVTAVEKAELDWNAPVYNVMGQKVSKGFTGIAIQNGKKFIVK